MSRVDVASGPVQRVNYVNDNNGNRLRQINRALSTDTAPLSTDTYSYIAGTNRLANVKTGTGAAAPTRTIYYDARGNTAAETRPGGVGVTTAYDGYGRLTQYARGAEALSFQYNGRDDRVAMTSPNRPQFRIKSL